MADVAIAESSTAALSRREHLLRTFESYRAELDADVSALALYSDSRRLDVGKARVT